MPIHKNRNQMRLTKVNFNNKTYSDGHYKDGTIHITIDSGHNADHPSPINPDPLIHVMGVALLHYYTPEIQAAAFPQTYSLKAGIKNIGDTSKTAAINELKQLHTPKRIIQSTPTRSPQTKRNKPSIHS